MPKTKTETETVREELRDAIRLLVSKISKSFISDWYTKISPTNHDFVASCEDLIETSMTRLVKLYIQRLDNYKLGQLIANLLHDHILDEKSSDRVASIENQIENFEYDICQNSVVRLFGLMSDDGLRRVVFTTIEKARKANEVQNQRNWYSTAFSKLYGNSIPSHTTSSRGDLPENNTDSSEMIKTTSALYTLVIAMLTKAVFMPVIDSISEPKWLYALIIWLCRKEEMEICLKNGREAGERSDKMDSSSCTRKINLDMEPSSDIATNNPGCSLDMDDISPTNINFRKPISLKRPLDNIEIYGTEEVKSNSSCYVLYCIRYHGICYRHPSTSGFGFRTIKRRFREFVLLQLRLEENPKIRPYMKNIPKPTKLKAATQNIFSLPGITNIKLDQSTIKLRQRFLERFLNALNGSPFIANSYEFKEFFSYNVNQSGSISKSKSTILQVNLNKVLVDGVKNAFSIIRSTLPRDGIQSLDSSESDPDAWLIDLQQNTLKLHIQTRTSHSKMNLERLIDSRILSLNETSSDSLSSSTESIYHDANVSLDINENGANHDTPIATKIIDIVHYSINGDTACSRSPINYLVRALLGRTLEGYARQFFEKAFTLENVTSIWDDGDDLPLDLDNANLDEAASHLSKLIETKFQYSSLIPKKLLMTMVNKQLKFYLSQIASKNRNKFVIYSFLVHVLDELEISD